MGHGSDHEANEIYEQLRNRFVDTGRDDIHIACVEGYPYIEDILPQLSEYKSGSSVTFYDSGRRSCKE